ncbi:MAG TPA: redoxin domain-containing protein, partial [Nitrospiraceae bacterium]|nr:redoxin domain-containing protein [Nitrospiraceae bacterium]
MPLRMLSGASLLLLAGMTLSWAVETPRPVEIGQPVGSFELSDFRGKAWKLADFESQDVLVVAFLGTECPLANQYGGRLVALAQKYTGQPVGIIAIDANQQDSLTELAHFARVHKIEFPLLKDPGNRVADQFGAERTPEVFVLDRERHVRYHGRIDDQFTYGIQRPRAEHEYLREAIDDLLAGREVKIATTDLVGSHIGRITQPDPTSEVTYSNQISRILQDHCVQCHRPGEIGPFSLTNYEEVVGWSSMLEEVVQQQRMPPWHANPEYGHYSNDTRLTDEEKSLLYRWVQAGSPEGNPADLPEPREYVIGWR